MHAVKHAQGLANVGEGPAISTTSLYAEPGALSELYQYKLPIPWWRVGQR